jgi:hypothetical protein
MANPARVVALALLSAALPAACADDSGTAADGAADQRAETHDDDGADADLADGTEMEPDAEAGSDADAGLDAETDFTDGTDAGADADGGGETDAHAGDGEEAADEPDARIDDGPDDGDDAAPDGGCCTVGAWRYCDNPLYSAWGRQTCRPDGRWGSCDETTTPSGCPGTWFYDVACCVAAGYCCQNFPLDDTSVGTCPGVSPGC